MPDQIRAGLEIRKRATVARTAPEPSDAERAARDDVARLLAAATQRAASDREDDPDIEPIDAVPRSSSEAQAALAKRLGY